MPKPARETRPAQRFLIPKLLAVTVVACAPAPTPNKIVAATCIADAIPDGGADGGCTDYSCDTATACNGWKPEETTFPDGGPGCICEPVIV